MTGGNVDRFDPFKDRDARMVRNQLSSAFIASLEEDDFSSVEKKATILGRQYDLPLYRNYLQERLTRYRQVLAALEAKPAADLFGRVAALWQQSLFFEVHELLEGEWMQASGRKRSALQGLIQAAGFYLLLEAGNIKGAERLADKAVQNLEENGGELPAALKIPSLIGALKKRDGESPVLLAEK